VTEAAYLADTDAAYERRFRATVVARPPGALVLDRTYFYPTGGGQPADHGTIAAPDGARFPVLDVRRSGASILHALGRGAGNAALPAPGTQVEGEIDWTRRYAHMRLHTGQHLLSALLFARTGLRTKAAALSGQAARIDLEAPWPESVPWAAFAEELLPELARPRPVRIEFVPRAEWVRRPAGRSGLVPLPPTVDPVRVIRIDGVDECPCGGTHLRDTGEIAPIELAPPQAQPGFARVTLTLRERAAHSSWVTP
jgi:misacylated tRNA(Ala) deacylase